MSRRWAQAKTNIMHEAQGGQVPYHQLGQGKIHLDKTTTLNTHIINIFRINFLPCKMPLFY
jgi:hypothetical protein